MIKGIAVVLSIFISMVANPVLSATVYVDASNTSDVEDGSQVSPYNTIPEGMNAAIEGDAVLVSPGIYYGMIELKHNVQLVSSDGPNVTVIDGMGEGWGVRSPYHSYPVGYIEGFTVRNAQYSLIDATNRVSFWQSSTLEVHNCILDDQENTNGRGISILPSARVTVTRTLFKNLLRGIDAIWCPAPQLKNVTIDNVSAAFFIYQIGLNLQNTTVTNADYVVELWGSRGYGSVSGSNNNFFDYTEFSKPNDVGRLPNIYLTASLYADPMFVADYHLSSGSSLIDAGIDVGLPYTGIAPDIGAYEFDELSIPELVETLAESYQDVPISAYKNVGENRRHALNNKFIAVLNMLDSIDETMTTDEVVSILTGARNKIEVDIWAKSDGYYGGNPQNDWVTTQEEQARIYEKVTELLNAIDEELAALAAT